MTEEQVELHVERRTDALDRAYMAGTMGTAEYQEGCRELSRWAERALRGDAA